MFKFHNNWTDEIRLNDAFKKTSNSKKLYHQVAILCHPDHGGNEARFDMLKKMYEKFSSTGIVIINLDTSVSDFLKRTQKLVNWDVLRDEKRVQHELVITFEPCQRSVLKSGMGDWIKGHCCDVELRRTVKSDDVWTVDNNVFSRSTVVALSNLPCDCVIPINDEDNITIQVPKSGVFPLTLTTEKLGVVFSITFHILIDDVFMPRRSSRIKRSKAAQ